MKKILGLILSFALTTGAFAQAPNKMSYQSVVRTSNGQLVANSTVSIRISILQGSANGNISYMETHSKTSNENGLVSLEIGGGSVILGTFSGINWATGPYFLKTETDPAGGTNFSISGTSQLMSVPYALYAAKSGDSGDWVKDANGINYSSKNVGIKTASQPDVSLTVIGDIGGPANNPALFTSNHMWHTAVAYKNNTSQYTFVVAGPNDLELAPKNFGIFNNNTARWPFTINAINNKVAIGNPTPYAVSARSALHVIEGDVNIEKIGNGIIMKSPKASAGELPLAIQETS